MPDLGFRPRTFYLAIITQLKETGLVQREFALPYQLVEALSLYCQETEYCSDHCRCHESCTPKSEYEEERWDNEFFIPPRFREFDRNENGEINEDAYRFRKCKLCGWVEPHPDR